MNPISNTALIDIDTLKTILSKRVDIETQTEILKDLEEVLENPRENTGEEDERGIETPKKIPKKLIALVTGLPPGITPQNISEIGGFICEIPEEETANSIPEKLEAIASEYSCSKKAKKTPANTPAELWEFASGKLFKTYGITKKSKSAVEFFAIPTKI